LITEIGDGALLCGTETPKQKTRIRRSSSTNHKQMNKPTGKVKTGTEQENGSRR
jgi:hypothetical protein